MFPFYTLVFLHLFLFHTVSPRNLLVITLDTVTVTVTRSPEVQVAAVQTPKSVLMTRNSLGVSRRKGML